MSFRLKNQLKQIFSPTGYNDRLKLPPGCGGPSQIVITGTSMVEVDGCEGLVDYETDHITFALTDRIVTVYGNDLSMKTFSQDHVAVCGKIIGVMEGPFMREVPIENH